MSTKYILLILAVLILSSCEKKDDSKLFSLLSSNATGITFRNILKETETFNVFEYGYLYNGGGVSIGDLNNDGLPDIYFTGNMVGSHLYINQGNLTFDEIAKEAGVFAEGFWNTGTTMADVNADGLLDIYVCRSAMGDPAKRKNLLFINNGTSKESGQISFTEKAVEYGIADSGYTTQASFFDYDKDGDLDLYVLNHSNQEYAGFGKITASLKNKKNSAFADKLYKNENGKFKDVSEKAGLISNVLGFGLGVGISDVNADSWPDIYISNDYNEQDYLYINNQDGTFSEKLQSFIGHTPMYSMGSDIADINNDGYTDIMALDMLPEGNYRQKMVTGPDNYDKYQRLVNSGFYNQTMRNMLQLNNQGKSFSEIGQLSGISNTDWSWSALFADLNLDGYKDLFITNGYKRDYTNMDFINYAVQEKLEQDRTGKTMPIIDLLKKIPSTVEENYTYKNKGDLTFKKVNTDWGLDQKSLSNGAAYADLDNDGDLDLVVNNIEKEAFIYRNNNEILQKNNFLKIKLKSKTKNTFGVGSKVSVYSSGQTYVQELVPTRGFQSSVGYSLVFGLGNATQIDSLTVQWPNAEKQLLKNINLNQTLTIEHADAKLPVSNTLSVTPAYFTDISTDSLIPFIHKENTYNDFKSEHLLPHKLSTQGPRLNTGDVNGDGLDDIYIGGAHGSSGKLLYQNKKGRFYVSNSGFATDAASEDTDVLFFDADNDGDLDLYVASGSNEYEIGAAELQDRLYLNNGTGNFTRAINSLPPIMDNSSCVKAADFDNDGDIDLFVGGRGLSGQYPLSTRSYILTNDGKGNFQDDTASINKDLEFPGMVTDAIWTDFNNDDKIDLILVGEFMPIRLFINTTDTLVELKNNTDLLASSGWWNRIEQGDFDNDGDMDYIIGNFGLNSQLKASEQEPVQLYHKDFDNNGSIDPVLTSFIMGESYPVFSKDDLLGQLGNLKSKYINYSDYADQQITDIFTSEELSDAEILEAKTFATSYLENLGDNQFKLNPLPVQAQFSPTYGILVQDFNTDGNLDVVLAGNFFGTRVKFGRHDANKGVLLFGNGKGDYRPVTTEMSGFNIDGEVRDIKSIKLNNDKDLILFARNNQAVKEYMLDGLSKK